jgi:hypothetical protein
MGSKAPRSPSGQRDSGYWVEAPRTTDAIGFTLRDTYADDRDLPDDMRELLSQISRADQHGGRDSHG